MGSLRGIGADLIGNLSHPQLCCLLRGASKDTKPPQQMSLLCYYSLRLDLSHKNSWVNEVKGIYTGLVTVEKKCVEIDQQQSSPTNKLSDEQWQALIALHHTLLHEHHDFFLASQHPSSSPALQRLATKCYASSDVEAWHP